MALVMLDLSADKTDFILSGSKRQRDKFKAWFLIVILGSSLCPAESIKNFGVWFDSDIPCLNMSTKVLLCNSVTSDVSGSF